MQIEIPDVDERGVSPVIGVILMVAITVILAAVIGAFVLDLGSNLGETGPQTQLSASDASGGVSDGGNDSLVTLSHKGGDELERPNINVIIEHGGASYSTDKGNLTLSGSGEITVGDTVTVEENSENVLTSSAEVTVRVVHKPSQSILLDAEVDVE